TLPTLELCGNNIDDNCDGNVDEGCCGNGTCDSTESCVTCSVDCGPCAGLGSFVSDLSWPVYDADPASVAAHNLGPAQESPDKDIANPIPGATWLWAPGVPLTATDQDLAQYYFSKEFDLPSAPGAGTITVAADDLVEVLVNGISVATAGC